jgi:hypothetical protein
MNASEATVLSADREAFAPGLFVIWQAASSHRQRILDDLAKRFVVVGRYDIEWSASRVMKNFERFYSDIDVRGVYHVFNKGAGPFTLVIVRDRLPRVEVRDTARGPRRVNAHFLDAKLRYRRWTSGLEVHCSETPQEANRDVMMLLGADMRTCQAIVTSPEATRRQLVCRDVSGTDGWESAAELFATLNECCNYVVLLEHGRSRDELFAGNARPLQIMTDDFPAMHRILNAQPAIQAAPQGGEFSIRVGGERQRIAIRFPGDNFIDPAWADAVLSRRVFDRSGYFRLTASDYFETLGYHVLAHWPVLPAARDEWQAAAKRLDRRDWHAGVLENPVEASAWLDQLLARHGYEYCQPKDGRLICRRPLDSRPLPPRTAGLRADLRRAAGHLLVGWWNLRDRLLLRLPWLRQLKRGLGGNWQRATAR